MPNAVTGSAAGPFIDTLTLPIDGDPLLAEASGSYAGVAESFSALLDNTAILSASVDTAIKTTGGSYALSNHLDIYGGGSARFTVDWFRCDGVSVNLPGNIHSDWGERRIESGSLTIVESGSVRHINPGAETREFGVTYAEGGSMRTVLTGALTIQHEQIKCETYGRVTQRLKLGPDSNTTISPRTEDMVIAGPGQGTLTDHQNYYLESVNCTTGDKITVQNHSSHWEIRVFPNSTMYYPNSVHGQVSGSIVLLNANDNICQATFVYSEGLTGEPPEGWYVTGQVKTNPPLPPI